MDATRRIPVDYGRRRGSDGRCARWNPKELIPIAVRQVRSFLRAHRPAQS